MRVGIRLPAVFDDAGEFLADAAAFDAAGADLLWLAAKPGELEALVLLAAVAAVAPRTCLGAALASGEAWPPALLDQAEATLRRLSRGRPVFIVRDELEGTLELDPGDGGAGPERWLMVPAPENRAAWAETLAAAAEAGATGVVAPASPRLLDILRNPDADPDQGRRDLLLAQG
jgi:hypothetical protein